jgi:hyperosmotically inducible periplasmic protein
MLRHTTMGVALLILGALPAGMVRAGEQPDQAPYAEKQESAAEKTERAANNAVEKVKGAAQTASKEFGDSWITLKTKLSLFADERVSSTDVHVTTHRGVIVLTGKVGSEEARQAAEVNAAKIEGAKKVENHLVVVPKAARKAVDREDDQIVKEVEGRIKNDPNLKEADIEVHADNGIVTLTGKAPSLTTSVRASEMVSKVPGVRAVHNELDVEEQQG